MRKTVTLDDDLNQLIREEMRMSGRTFKQVVNDALRRGFAASEELSKESADTTKQD